MSSFNKMIKIALTVMALALAISIIGLIVKVSIVASTVIIKIEDYIHNDDSMSDSELIGSKNVTMEFSDINAIKIESDMGNIYLKTGDCFKVEGIDVHKEFVCFDDDGVLTIENKRLLNLINYNSYSPYIELTLPKSFVAEYVDIDMGAGVLDITSLSSDKFTLNSGVGVSKLKKCVINDLDINAGIGEVDIVTTLTGKSHIDCGIGEVSLTVLGDVGDYYINAEKGIGNLVINDKKRNSNYELNKGAKNSIYIEGGIGDFALNFK